MNVGPQALLILLWRSIIAVVAALIVGISLSAGVASAAPDLGSSDLGIDFGSLAPHGCSADFTSGDRRLGPDQLANTGPVGTQVRGYRRTGNLSTEAFLAKYWDASLYGGSGGWIYPPADGYVTTPLGSAIKQVSEQKVGAQLDRYGSEYGAFLAPAGAAYAKRSIPPTNFISTPADYCNYHLYKVAKAFKAYQGAIAPWFGQPGGGQQVQLDATLIAGAPNPVNVQWLLTAGYLTRVLPAS